MADQGRWFKVWVSSLRDPALDNLSLEDFARWVKMGTLIKEQGTNGELIVSAPSLSLCANLKVETFDALICAIKRLPSVGVSTVTSESVSFSIKYENWHKYQGDFSTDRVKRFRAKRCQSETPKKRREEKRGEDTPKPPIPYSEIVEYLNQKAGKGFRGLGKTKDHIRARIGEGFTLEEFKLVIDLKVEQWKNKPDMILYLRPETLFGTKFEGYLQEAKSSGPTRQYLNSWGETKPEPKP